MKGHIWCALSTVTPQMLQRRVAGGLGGIASSLTPLRLSPRHWWVWVACLIATDFCYYWAHRADHRVRLLWTAHSVHHSSRFFNLSTNLRLPWFHPVSYTLRSLAWVPVALLGFPVSEFVKVFESSGC